LVELRIPWFFTR